MTAAQATEFVRAVWIANINVIVVDGPGLKRLVREKLMTTNVTGNADWDLVMAEADRWAIDLDKWREASVRGSSPEFLEKARAFFPPRNPTGFDGGDFGAK
jgi:hypothetical protein